MAEYLAEPEVVRARTLRLRALRLERDASQAMKEQKAAAEKKNQAAERKMTIVKLHKPRKRVLYPPTFPL
jgi:hypothetical protein